MNSLSRKKEGNRKDCIFPLKNQNRSERRTHRKKSLLRVVKVESIEQRWALLIQFQFSDSRRNYRCSAQTQTRMGCLRKSQEVEFDSYRSLSHLGVRAPYAARRKRRYEANQVWMNTTFISQGPQSWGKLAVKT